MNELAQMLPLIGTCWFVINFGLAAWFWRRRPLSVLEFVIRGGYVALATVALISAIGVPLLLYRLGYADISFATVSAIVWIHHYLGHVFMTGFWLFWPVLMVTCVARPRSWWRKVILGGVAVVSLVLFLFTVFTGYLLPNAMPRKLTDIEDRHALRFVVLHVVVSPIVASVALAAVLWRHTKAVKRAAQAVGPNQW